MLILPPFQGEGHGAQLLEAVHRFYCGLPKVQDITGESLFVAVITFWLLIRPGMVRWCCSAQEAAPVRNGALSKVISLL